MAEKASPTLPTNCAVLPLDLQLKRAEIKRSCALPKLSLRIKLCKAALDVVYQRDRYIQLMMPGENSCNVVLLHALNGVIEKHRVCGWVKGVQTASINQITGEQVLPFRFIKAAMSGGMSRCMQNHNAPPAQVQAIVIMQEHGRFATINLIRVWVQIRRKGTGLLQQTTLNGLKRERKPNGQPILFQMMNCNLRKNTGARRYDPNARGS